MPSSSSIFFHVRHAFFVPIMLATACTTSASIQSSSSLGPAKTDTNEEEKKTEDEREARSPGIQSTTEPTAQQQQVPPPNDDTWVEEAPPKNTATESDGQLIDNGGQIIRKNIYRYSNGIFRVEINGSEFTPQVEAVRMGAGWGVKLKVSVKVREERFLSSPANGPLSFGGQVKRSENEWLKDTRQGDGTMTLTPGKTVTFERTWPDKGQTPLLTGEQLNLQVGLWGLGPSLDEQSPVRRLVVVRMIAGKKRAQPTVEPPHF